MSEFVFLFRSTDAASRAAMGSPEQMQKSMQTWMTWRQQLADKGHIKDRGNPLERTGALVTGKQRPVTDAPDPEAEELYGGSPLHGAGDRPTPRARSRARATYRGVSE